jgi:hypothetical protein
MHRKEKNKPILYSKNFKKLWQSKKIYKLENINWYLIFYDILHTCVDVDSHLKKYFNLYQQSLKVIPFSGSIFQRYGADFLILNEDIFYYSSYS